MPVFSITDQLVFPDPELAGEDGLLGVGGDLSPERLLLAYDNGIFPWHDHKGVPMWWSPDPRCVLFPGKINISRSLRRKLNKGAFTVTFDRRFEEVIKGCAHAPRAGGGGTWITPEFVSAYTRLHELGYAHSVEVLMEGTLAGGLYGVATGRIFSGESMFSLRPDASKIALVYLAERLKQKGFLLIDCQIANPYLLSMGAEEMGRKAFLRVMRDPARGRIRSGKWEA